MGRGGVCICRGGEERRFEHGHNFALDELGQVQMPDPRTGIPDSVWEDCQEREETLPSAPLAPPEQILAIARAREAARSSRDWAAADQLRERLAAAGWEVRDTSQGQQLNPISETGSRD
jgi:cysteinyl-tRNA synthetase